MQTAVTALIVTVIVFGLARMTGDPTALLLPMDATVEDREFFRHQLGLDQPLPLQYVTYLTNALTGDLGTSFRFRLPALDLVLDRLPATMLLAGSAMVFAILVGLPCGILAAIKKDSWIDGAARWFATFGEATPSFWLGIVLIMIFAVEFRLVPSAGIGGFQHLILPTITLGWSTAAALSRLMRSSLLEVFQHDFIRTQRLNGLPEWLIILKHALKNASIPVVTYLALQFGVLLSGAVVTETVFAWPGLGQLVVDAINARDYPVIQAAVLVAAIIFLLLNLVVDLLYGWLDPRIRYS